MNGTAEPPPQTASAPSTPESATAVTFEHAVPESGPPGAFVHELYSWGWQTLPRHFDKAAAEGSFVHVVAATERPRYPPEHPSAGKPMGTQWLVFRFRSEGLFTATHAHVAVIGRSQATAAWNRGRGFVFGHQVLLPDDPNACPVGPAGSAHAQPETWWTASTAATQAQRNHVWGPPLCSTPSILDFRDYQVALHVADGGWVAFWIVDVETNEQISVGWQDTINAESELVDGLTGYALALVNGASRSQPWRFIIHDIRAGWF